MEEKVLVLAYPGSGKTYLAENYKNVIDLEFQHFRWDYGENKHLPLEQLKGCEQKSVKTEWPENFFKYLEEKISGGGDSAGSNGNLIVSNFRPPFSIGC